MTNHNYNNNDGRHFANTGNTQNYDDPGRTRPFTNLYGITGYERNLDFITTQKTAEYNDGYTYAGQPQPVKPAPKKQGAKARVVAIVMASIAAASAITAGFVVFNSIGNVNKAKTAASDTLKTAAAAKLQADKAIESAKQLKLEKETAEKKLAEQKKAEAAKKAEELKKAEEAKKAEAARKAEEAKKAEEAEKKAFAAKKAELEKQQKQLEEQQKKFEQEKKAAEKQADEKATETAQTLLSTSVEQ